MVTNNSFEVQIDLKKVVKNFDCIALITNHESKILLVNSLAEDLFPNWQDNLLINYLDYDRGKLKKLYEKVEEKLSVFNWEIFFSSSGTLVYLEISAFKIEQYYLLLANSNPSKIEYLNRITALTGEINLLNQKLSKKNHLNIDQNNNDKYRKPNLSTPNLIDNNYFVDKTNKKIVYPNFEICAVTRKVTVRDKNVRLTAREFELLWLMASHPNQIFTRNYLLNTIWEADYSGDDNTVTVHIRRLRKKIEDNPNKPQYIKTVWGVGYRFDLA
ncbi:winged helix-turn-helix domain-containing protein [Desulfolucanica intricata]|uniref:winged helix-turn-helix domain-containing protein n=1 Tax=Desulfolucanica intricata TaxID=1285191 RepID=UPI0008341965|nr:response regulator transcription factor [Desulfolucanica intricata]